MPETESAPPKRSAAAPSEAVSLACCKAPVAGDVGAAPGAVDRHSAPLSVESCMPCATPGDHAKALAGGTDEASATPEIGTVVGQADMRAAKPMAEAPPAVCRQCVPPRIMPLKYLRSEREEKEEGEDKWWWQ